MTFRLKITGLDEVRATWRGFPLAVEMYTRRVGNGIGRNAKKVINIGVKRIHPKSKRRAPSHTRQLHKSVRVLDFKKAGFDSIALVGSEVRHAKWYTLGTKPHIIERRLAKVLTIFAPSAPDADEYGFIFRRRVNHPGTAGRDWRHMAWILTMANKAGLQRAWGASIRLAAKRLRSVPDFGTVPTQAGGLERVNE